MARAGARATPMEGMMSDYQNRYDRLGRECRNQAATVHNGVVVRRDHPSYGYTKRGLVDGLSRLEGMLTAWLILSGYVTYGATPMIGPVDLLAIRSHLEVDLEKLRAEVKSS